MQVGVVTSSVDMVRKVASPMKVLDYAACGLPVITADVGEWSIMITEYDSGIVTKNSDPEEFADALMQLSDRRTWRRKSENARNMVKEKFLWQNTVKPIVGLYDGGVKKNENTFHRTRN